MKRVLIVFLFTGISLIALLFGISCSNQTPNTAFLAPLTTVSAINPTWTGTPTLTFTPTSTFTSTPIPFSTPISGLNGPFALAIDSKNNIYVGDTGNNLIKQFGINAVQNVWPSGKVKSMGLAYTSPKAISVDGLGNLYVVGNGNAVSKYDTTGDFIAQYTSSMSSTLSGVAVNAANSILYVSDSGVNQIVSISIPGGGLNNTFGTSGKLTSSYTPYGLAVDNMGNLYVAGSDNKVHIYTSTGVAGTTASISGFNGPYAIALDANNDLYVSDTFNSQIEEFTFGNYTSPANIIGLGSLSKPEGIALDSFGNVYLVDSGYSELFQFP